MTKLVLSPAVPTTRDVVAFDRGPSTGAPMPRPSINHFALGSKFRNQNAGYRVPPSWRHWITPGYTLDKPARRIVSPRWAEFDTRRAGFYTAGGGCEIEALRIVETNGKTDLVSVLKTRVEAARINVTRTPTGSSTKLIAPGETVAYYDFPGFSRPEQTYRVYIAAVKGTERSAFAGPVLYTTPADMANSFAVDGNGNLVLDERDKPVRDELPPNVTVDTAKVQVEDKLVLQETSAITENTGIAKPTGLGASDHRPAGGMLRINWNAQTGVDGFLVVLTDGDSPIEEAWVQVEDDITALRDDDWIRYRTTLVNSPAAPLYERDIVSPRIAQNSPTHNTYGQDRLRFNGAGYAFGGDVPSGDFYFMKEPDGTPFLRIVVTTGEATMASIGHGGIDEEFRYPLQPGDVLRTIALVRSPDAGAEVELSCQKVDLDGGGDGTKRATRAVGNDWTEVTLDASRASPLPGGESVASEIRFGPGTYDVRIFDTVNAAEEMFMPSAMSLEDLRAGRWSEIRQHTGTKTYPTHFTVWEYLRKGGGGAMRGDSLWTNLTAAKLANAGRPAHLQSRPHLQMSVMFTDDEVRLVAEYLYEDWNEGDDPAAKPAAYRRHLDGRSEAWFREFPGFVHEVGNENWNSTATFAYLPSVSGYNNGIVNGVLTQHYHDIIAEHPNYDPDPKKNAWYFCGHSQQVGGFTAGVLHAPCVDYIGWSFYTKGWDAGDSVLPTRTDLVQRYTMVGFTETNRARIDSHQALVDQCVAWSANRAKPLRVLHYEGCEGYQHDGLNGAKVTRDQEIEQAAFMKSVPITGAILTMILELGWRGPSGFNYFGFDYNMSWGSRVPQGRGGAISPGFMLVSRMWAWFTGRVKPLDLSINARLTHPVTGAQPDVIAAKGFRIDNDEEGYTTYFVYNMDTTRALDLTLRKSADVTGACTMLHMPNDAPDGWTHNSTPETKDAVRLVETVDPEGVTAREIVATIPAMEFRAWRFAASV